jgi:hypothetical protein
MIMKKIFSPDVTIVTLIIASAVFSTCNFNRYQRFDADPLAGPVELPQVSDSLPHWKWRAITDSVKMENYLHSHPVHSFNILSLGYSIYNVYKKDSLPRESQKYFLSLSGYRMRPETDFVIKDGKAMVAYPVWDKIEKNSRSGHTETKSTAVHFAKDHAAADGRGFVLLPMSNKSFQVARILLWFLSILLSLIFFWAIVITPAMILVRIAKGNSFSPKNSRGFYIMAIATFAVYLLPLLLAAISKLFFSNSIPPEMHFDWLENMAKGRAWLLAGFILLLIARAFQQGYKIQKENETIV